MAINNAQHRVLLIGKSQVVLDESVAGLRALGYEAQGTSDFTQITGRFDVKKIDLVVFGGQVPEGRKAELRDEIGGINPDIPLLDNELAGGDHVIPVPEHVPPNTAFATVEIDAAIYAFSIATSD